MFETYELSKETEVNPNILLTEYVKTDPDVTGIEYLFNEISDSYKRFELDSETINTRILNVYTYWFSNKQKWFNATKEDDEEITNKFLSYLSFFPYTSRSIREEVTETNILSIKEKLAYIILYDQMVRHFYRVENRDINKEQISFYHEKALSISMEMLLKNEDTKLNAEERCFLLLPLRHTFDLYYLEIVINKIQKYMNEEKNISSIYKRFWKATLISHSQIKICNIEMEEINENILDTQIFEILDKEHKSVENLTVINNLNYKNKFYRVFDTCLSNFNNISLGIAQKYNTQNSISNKKIKRIIISLSGGVDSMVCSFILYHYCKVKNIELIAIHINYGNRETCDLEVELVKRWCKLLDIKLYILHIEYLRRNRSVDRDIYEEITRIMRFQMYKRFTLRDNEKIECDNSTQNEDIVPVILGHNRDDCEENMITNIRKSKCYNNLLGMKEIGQENGVTILRPMLNILKSEIYDFAYEYDIPHLYDSTPDWSDRGRMRNELIPYLNKFDAAFIPGLFKISKNLEMMYKIYETTVLNKFRKEKIYKYNEDSKITFILVNSKSEELDYGYQFWKDIIYGILLNREEKTKIILPSNKSIRFLANKLEKRHYGKISLNNNLKIYFQADNLVLHIE